jgi:hypothetical protein
VPTSHDESDYTAIVHDNYPYDSSGHTNHLVDETVGDCWCEPRVLRIRHSYKGVQGPLKVYMHQPVHDQSFISPPILRQLAPPPEGGWDAVMDKEAIGRLLDDVMQHGGSLEACVMHQRKDETPEQFMERIEALSHIRDSDTSKALPPMARPFPSDDDAESDVVLTAEQKAKARSLSSYAPPAVLLR